jgi:hypothetical protein
MIELNGGMSVGGTLFLPGRTIDGTGSNEWSAICNIINKLTTNVNNVSNVSPQPQQNIVEAPKKTSDSVQKELEAMKAKTVQQNVNKPVSDAEAIFNDLIGDDASKATETKEETKEEQTEEFLEFGTPECDAYEKNFWDQVNAAEALKNPTPDEVNPNHIVMRQMWNDEQGEKLRQWAKEHGINGKEQMSTWFKRYCGLEYDYFNPEWVDKFILWAKALREKQTY